MQNQTPQALLENLTTAGSMPQVRQRFAEFLGLDDPLPDPVIHRALSDRPFLHNLIVSRGSPQFLQILISDPKNAAFPRPPEGLLGIEEPADPDVQDPAEAKALPGSLRLAARAAGALARWGAAGIVRVEPEVFEQRWSSCQACPHLIEPPERVVYKITSSLAARQQADARVCAACGCVAQRKARLPTERCPRADPAQPNFNRWGQALAN
ncbi:hypothetical protein [Paracidovorax cattleyae]|uniref:Uncharacterized protein n=1 Tax=Paracidovorax cattleyae TaxID=80868 RepID=A0A1H0U6M9_9BURK|nr:hypothetical protein [Paracidovorax cattleyae]MBF9264060.1 hypothetical protein [Paracidovorax cattleyae]SDP61811.1 hypothetical protein SAMN04489708_11817 [Paracidovorax cattleyae]